MSSLHFVLIENSAEALLDVANMLGDPFTANAIIRIRREELTAELPLEAQPNLFFTHDCGDDTANAHIISRAKALWPDAPCIFLTAEDPRGKMASACHWGAWDVLQLQRLDADILERASRHVVMAALQRRNLQRREEQMKSILRATRCCLLELRITDGCLLDISSNAAQLLEVPLKHLIGNRLDQIDGFAHAKDSISNILAKLQATEEVDADLEYHRRDGTILWLQLRATPESATSAQAVLMDISHMHQMRRTRDLLQEAINQSGEAILITDADIHHPGPRVEFMNAAAERLTGYSIDELQSQSLRVLRGAESDWRAINKLRDCLKEEKPFAGELVNYHRNGRPYLCQSFIQPIRDRKGVVRNYLCVQRDITSERRVQRALADSEQRLRQVVDRAPFPVMILADDGTILQLSQSWSDMSGYPASELRTIDDWIRRACTGREDRIRKGIMSCFAKDQPVIREQGQVRHADGSSLTWLFYSAPIRPLADGRQLIVTMASDVTEIKQALSSAERASRAKDEFLAVMSHELRTPLNPVVGLTDLLLHGEKDPDKLEMLEMVRQSAHGLLKLIDNILDYTHIDLGRFQINPEEESLREMIFEVVDVVRDGFERKGLTLNINGDGCAELWDEPVITDPRRVRQILEHLLSNALKFTPRGNVDILASLDLTGDSSATAHIAVRDTGIGINEEDKERILAPFHQADSSSTREFGGTGLGLAICCRILEGLQGKLRVESTPGIGSTFTVSIPVSLPPGVP